VAGGQDGDSEAGENWINSKTALGKLGTRLVT
jgi:hypothetical protein